MESLCRQYQFEIAVEGPASAHIFENNPHVRQLPRDECHILRMENPTIHKSHLRPVHFVQSYVDFFNDELDLDLDLLVPHPVVYMTDAEKTSLVLWDGDKPWAERMAGIARYWLLNAGTKADYTTKGWARYQDLVDATPEIKWVQVGSTEHVHRPLRGVVDLIGLTDTRQLLRLAYHAEGAVTGVSFLHHIMAAHRKPCVTLASGMEPAHWEAYATGTFLHRGHLLPCGNMGLGCWKARTVALGDGDEKDRSLCHLPVLPAAHPKCMDLIGVDEVVQAVRRYGLMAIIQGQS